MRRPTDPRPGELWQHTELRHVVHVRVAGPRTVKALIYRSGELGGTPGLTNEVWSTWAFLDTYRLAFPLSRVYRGGRSV